MELSPSGNDIRKTKLNKNLIPYTNKTTQEREKNCTSKTKQLTLDLQSHKRRLRRGRSDVDNTRNYGIFSK